MDSHSTETDTAIDAAGSEMLPRGTVVGRYVVLDVIGHGGAGVVYRAYDPELDRVVALKLVRADGGAGRTDQRRERLVREGRALARVAHPHVIAIYDVGTHEGDVFLAMEFVEGPTLATWLRETSPSPRRILEIFRAAGEGLAAAHAAGLVHRDFKPENVLVGNDGRVRVVDFGLARTRERLTDTPAALAAADAHAHPMSRSTSDQASERSEADDASNAFGTPRYMSPEQHLGENPDARSDQFSFAVALYEALYGEHPFGGGPPLARAERVIEGAVTPPPAKRGVPSRTGNAIVRALAADPARRHAAMPELLEALRVEGPARRGPWILAGAVILGATVLVALRGRPSSGPSLCDGAEQKLIGVWDAGRREAVRAALGATQAPFAEQGFAAAARAFDAYAREWTSMRTEACAATRIRGEQSEELLELRMQCLDRRLLDLRAQVDVLAHADTKITERAATAAASLPVLSTCADGAALRAPVMAPSDPQVRRALDELRARAAEGRALYMAGKLVEAEAKLAALLDAADQLRYAPVIAEVAFHLGMVRDGLGRYAEAESTFHRAVVAAEEGRDDYTMTRGLARIAWVVGERLDRHDEAERWARHAAGMLTRLSDRDESEGELLAIEASLAYRKGHYADAIVFDERALGPLRRAHGEDSLEVAHALDDLAGANAQTGDAAAALTHFQEALRIVERLFGPDHPSCAGVLNNSNPALRRLGRYDEAVAVLERALRIYDKLGTEHPHAQNTLFNMGDTLSEMGEYARALPYIEQALARAIRTRGADDADVGEMHLGRGNALLGLRRPAAARVDLERALAIHGKLYGLEHPFVGSALLGLGRAALLEGQPSRARPLLERALVIRRSQRADRIEIARAEAALAQALSALHVEEDRARELLTHARSVFALEGPIARMDLEGLATWDERIARR